MSEVDLGKVINMLPVSVRDELRRKFEKQALEMFDEVLDMDGSDIAGLQKWLVDAKSLGKLKRTLEEERNGHDT